MRRALGHIGRGFKDSFKGIVTTMKERPVMCVGIIGALVGATLLWPAAMGVIIPGIQVVNSSIKAGRSIYKSVKAPDPRAAEAALAGVGDGIAGMALLGAGMAVGRVLRMFRNAGLIHLVDDAPPLLDLVKDLLNRKK